MQRIYVLIATIAFVTQLSFSTGANGQATHWQTTDRETIWRNKYSNCDHGYYVLLPFRVIGHSELPPAPNHGFQIDLANPSSAEIAHPAPGRTFWVWDGPGFESESGVPKPVASPWQSQARPNEKTVQFLRRSFLKVGGQKAVRIQSSRKSGTTLLLEDYVNVFNPDAKTEYQFELVSPQNYYQVDKRLFDQVLAGFHFTTIANGECSND